MVVHRRKKVTKFRGSRTHGWGLVHRGSGQKGGVGNAGSGKRADCKLPSFWSREFGKIGFKSKGVKPEVKVINLKDIEEKLESWKKNGLVEEKQGVFNVDLKKIGFTKLLSTGFVSKKIKVSVACASKSVGEKLAKAGGELIVQK